MKKRLEFLEMKSLSKRIYLFLDKYAGIRPDWDPEYDDEEDKFTSPDASLLKYCADMLSDARIPLQCSSSWSSGGYLPYLSIVGKEEHDYLVKEILEIMRGKQKKG